MDGFQLAGQQGSQGAGGTGGVYGPLPGGGTGGLDFATLVAQKTVQVEGLKQELANLAGQSANRTSNQEYLDKLDHLKSELDTAQTQLNNLQAQIAGADPADPASAAAVANLQQQVVGMEQMVGGMYAEMGLAMNGGPAPAGGSNPSDPALPPGDTNAEVNEPVNLFLATSMMAILFAVEAKLVHQHIENKDAERQCKQLGFEEIRQWGKVEAQSAYNSDMDQANMYLAQAACSFASAGLTAFSAGMMVRSTGKTLDEAATLKDNPEYDAATTPKDPKNLTKQEREYQQQLNVGRNKGDQTPVLKKVDSNGDFVKDSKGRYIEIRPGQKQMQNRMNELNSPKYQSDQEAEIVKNGGTKAEADSKLAAQKAQMKDRMEDNRADIRTAEGKTQWDSNCVFWRQMAPSLNQSITGAFSSLFSSLYTADKARQDYNKTLASIAREAVGRYLQSAFDAFSQENQSISALIDFLMQAAQKNTQWASVRA